MLYVSSLLLLFEMFENYLVYVQLEHQLCNIFKFISKYVLTFFVVCDIIMTTKEKQIKNLRKERYGPKKY